MTAERKRLIADAIAAGYTVKERRSFLYIVRRHAGNGSILRGIVLYASGTAFDMTVRLDIAKGLRSYADMRRVLGLNP